MTTIETIDSVIKQLYTISRKLNMLPEHDLLEDLPNVNFALDCALCDLIVIQTGLVNDATIKLYAEDTLH